MINVTGDRVLIDEITQSEISTGGIVLAAHRDSVWLCGRVVSRGNRCSLEPEVSPGTYVYFKRHCGYDVPLDGQRIINSGDVEGVSDVEVDVRLFDRGIGRGV